MTGTSHRTVDALTQVAYVDELGEVEVIQATGNHEFYVQHTGTNTQAVADAGWVQASDLLAGDTLLLADGRSATVTSTTTIAAPAGVQVYNLSVTDGKTYYVDDGQGNASAAWVHNAGFLRFRGLMGFGRSNGTVAAIVVNGKRYHGISSGLHGVKGLAQRENLLKFVHASTGALSGKTLNRARAFTHAESHALYRAAKANGGKLPRNVTIIVDKRVCNFCTGINGLPQIKKAFDINKLTIISPGRTIVI